MKTKLLLTTLVVVLCCGTTFSQTYVPMLNNSTWNLVSANFFGNENLMMGPGTDVVLGPYTYKKYIDPTMYNSDNYVRENVATKKVYRNVNGVDQLLYDFSLQLGNTIVLSDGLTYTVQSITNVNVIGGTRREFFLVNWIGTIAGRTETWIEGVGSPRHPLKRESEMIFSDPYIYTTCSAQNGVVIYNHGIANGQSTPTDCSMLLTTQEMNTIESTMYPNPFRSELNITTRHSLSNASLQLYNSIGQLVKEMDNLNGTTITLQRDHLLSGVYILKLEENNQIISSAKVVVE